MKTKIAGLLAIVSMFMIVAMSWMPTASAEDVEGTQTIDEDQFWHDTIGFFSGDYLTVSFTIDVQNDQYIDVMFLDEENYNRYVNDQSFSYYMEGTDFNTIYKNVPSMTLTTHDNYHLVVDNTDDPPGGAQPAWDGVNNYCTFYYHVSAEGYYYDSGDDPLLSWPNDPPDRDDEALNLVGALCVLGILSVMIIVIIATAVYVKKKGQQPQPYYPPQQPQYQPPPPPPDYRPPQQPY